MRKKAIKQFLKVLKEGKQKPTPKPRGGIIHPRCRSCGGVVYHSGRGVITERCSECGETYHEPRIA